jgi:hypothetical protein
MGLPGANAPADKDSLARGGGRGESGSEPKAVNFVFRATSESGDDQDAFAENASRGV